MLILGIIIIIVSLYLLYLKYRVVFTGEKCKGKIIGIVDQNAGYVVGGISVKKHAYIIKIKNKKYYTAHGCILLSLGKRKIGKEIFVFKNEKEDAPLSAYVVSIDSVEALTGMDFFSELPDELENRLESQNNIFDWEL